MYLVLIMISIYIYKYIVWRILGVNHFFIKPNKAKLDKDNDGFVLIINVINKILSDIIRI